MSVQAISWVLSDTPELPPHLVATLIGLANHAHEDGRGAYPSVTTLARYAHKSERQVQSDLRELIDLGFIREGDQRFTVHMRADRRPTVYDLIISNESNGVQSTSPRDFNEVQPTAPREPNGVKYSVERGEVERPHGVKPTSPEPSTKPKANPARVRAREDAPHHTLDTVIDTIKKTTGRTISRDWARTVADHITAGRTLNDPAAYARQAIENEPTIQRFLPTPIPPRIDRRAVADARAHRTPSEAKTELITATRQKLRTTMAPSSPF